MRAEATEAPTEFMAFFESPGGLLVLHRIVLATIYVLTQLCGGGVRTVCTFLHLSGLWRVAGHGYGTQQQAVKQMEQSLIAFGAEERRRLAAEMDLVSWPESLGPGLAVWHPKGALVRKMIEDYSRDRHEAGGYDFVYSPHIAKAVLWETSGHLDFYADGMFPPMELGLRIVSRLLLLPVIAGVAYEFLRFSAAHQDNTFIRWITKPNLALQHLTTAEPDLSMLEVAITAFQQVVLYEQGEEVVPETAVLVEAPARNPAGHLAT
jgi:hypothetical protein